MGKRSGGKPAPPSWERADDIDEDDEITMPSDDSPTVWSIITQQTRDIERLQSANDRLIARLLAAGVNESLVFEDAEENTQEPSDYIELSPLTILLRNNNNQIAKLEKKSEQLNALLISKETEQSQNL